MSVRKSASGVRAKKNSGAIPGRVAVRDQFPFDLNPKEFVSLKLERLLATRTVRGWSFPRGRRSKLLPHLRGTMTAWAQTARVGDRICWYHELALVAAFAAGGEGVRLMRGNEVLAQFRFVEYL